MLGYMLGMNMESTLYQSLDPESFLKSVEVGGTMSKININFRTMLHLYYIF